MEISGKTIRFPDTLWVQHGGVNVKHEEGAVAVAGVDEDSYLKVFNHFGRVLKLYTFEDGQWVDSATGAAPMALDESLAGHVPAAPKPAAAKATKAQKTPLKKKPAGKASAANKPAKRAAKTPKRNPVGKAAAKTPKRTSAVKRKG